jgi:hypothetical protein
MKLFYSVSKQAALSLLLLATLHGCSASHYTVVEPAKHPLSNFSILEIQNFSSNLPDADSSLLANRFADKLYSAVINDRKASPDGIVFDKVVRATDQIDDVLVMQGTIISFEKGSRAKRFWIGFGAGKAYCTIQAEFKNKATGDSVLKMNFDGEISMGITGGSEEEAVDAIVRAFIDYFDDYAVQEGLKPL